MARSVIVVSKGATEELQTRFGASPDNSSKSTAAGVGVGTGAVAGAGAALACGPFAILCATFTVPIGALVGGVGGNIAGSAVDAQKKPPEEQLLVLDELFVEISKQRTIHVEIEDTLKQEIPASRQVSIEDAYMLLETSLSDVKFTQTSPGNYALTLEAILEAEWNRDMRHIRNGRRAYRYISRSRPLEDWIEDEGVTLNLAFDACVGGLVEDMVKDIRFTQSPATDTGFRR